MSLRVELDATIGRKFRELAMKRFGYGKGALSKAASEAIVCWVSSVENEAVCFEGDPVEAVVGLLKGVDLSSVELQHNSQKIWGRKLLDNVSC